MSNNTKPKTVNYRLCVAAAPGSGAVEKFDLQALLEKAKEKNTRPWIRQISADGSISLFLSHLVSKGKCLCGTLVLTQANRLIPLVDAEPDGSTWEGAVEPKDDKGKKRKFEEQKLIFAVRENHVAVIQTKELTIGGLQDFLTWFIQSKADLAQGWLFVLQNLPSAKAVAKLKDHTIKGIKIGKQAFSIVKKAAPSLAEAQRKRFTTSIETDPMVLSWLKNFIKDDAVLGDMEDSKDPGSIYVELAINYRSRSEKQSQQVMRALAATIGDQPGLSPEIRLDGKSRIKGDDLTIAGDTKVQCPGGNMSADDAMARVAEWLQEAINSGKVFS